MWAVCIFSLIFKWRYVSCRLREWERWRLQSVLYTNIDIEYYRYSKLKMILHHEYVCWRQSCACYMRWSFLLKLWTLKLRTGYKVRRQFSFYCNQCRHIWSIPCQLCTRANDGKSLKCHFDFILFCPHEPNRQTNGGTEFCVRKAVRVWKVYLRSSRLMNLKLCNFVGRRVNGELTIGWCCSIFSSDSNEEMSFGWR